jgi:hypothetical protein
MSPHFVVAVAVFWIYSHVASLNVASVSGGITYVERRDGQRDSS